MPNEKNQSVASIVSTMRLDTKSMSFSNVEKINPLFSKAKARVMYVGNNRNNSSMNKAVITKAIPTLYNVPIVGEFVEEKQDFGGHGGKVEIEDNKVKYVHTTKPIGVVPESATVYWEQVEEDNGETNEYLVADGVFLWTGRYEEANSIVKDGKGQSMEIKINAGKFNKQRVYEIEDFTFSALCVLGDGVEPCFESANIESYSLNKAEFQREFSQMVDELKMSLSTPNDNENEGGSQAMPNEKEKEAFSLSTAQMTQEFNRILRADFEEDEWGYKAYNFYYVDHTEEFVVAQSRQDQYRLVGIPFSVEGDVPVVKFEEKQVFKVEYKPLEEGAEAAEFAFKHNEAVEYEVNVKAKELETELTGKFTAEKEEAVGKITEAFEQKLADEVEKFTALEAEFTTVTEEKEELAKFKLEKLAAERTEAEAELFERFSHLLPEEAINEVKAKSETMELEEIRFALYVLVGKKSAEEFAKAQAKESQAEKAGMKVPVENFSKSDSSTVPYAHIIKKHTNK